MITTDSFFQFNVLVPLSSIRMSCLLLLFLPNWNKYLQCASFFIYYLLRGNVCQSIVSNFTTISKFMSLLMQMIQDIWKALTNGHFPKVIRTNQICSVLVFFPIRIQTEVTRCPERFRLPLFLMLKECGYLAQDLF